MKPGERLLVLYFIDNNKSLNNIVENVLEDESEETRKILECKFIEGLNNEQITSKMGLDHHRVGYVYKRVISKIEKELNK